jgi:hypothetical protein
MKLLQHGRTEIQAKSPVLSWTLRQGITVNGVALL